MAATTLDKLKTALRIKPDNTEFDDLLKLYIEDATTFLALNIGVSTAELPEQSEPIIRGAAVKKFNRLNNEGMAAYSQDGESITFKDGDFDEWADIIDQWRQQLNDYKIARWVSPYEI